jgi:hypothetical protein
VEGYQRRPLGAASGDIESSAREALDEAGDFLRRLIPFPGAEVLSPLSLLPLPAQSVAAQSNPVNAVADIAGGQAASIVSQAASILDEEMARGVLAAARRPAGTAPYGQSDTSNPLVRQVHEVVDNFAAVWPSLQGLPAQGLVASQPVATETDALAELRPGATVKPGQRATICMTLCNSESRAVRLVPAATDLLGSRGGRIACSLLEFTPTECRLEPQEQRDLTISTTVPLEAAPGCYSGLLVVRGVDYLRALITIEVA